MNNCQQCNSANQPGARFCNNCGAPLTHAAPDLPATVFGALNPPNEFRNQPQNFQNSPNSFQNEPNFSAPHEPNFGAQNLPPAAAAPPKSNARKFAVIGGVIGLLVFAVGGFALWRNVIEPYRYEQRRLKREIDNQNRADSTTAMSLVPAQFDYYGASGDVYRRKETLDKLQLLQAAQNLPPALKQKTSEMNDAAAATYVSDKQSSYKVVLQIFKFNTPEQAKNVCQEVIEEVEKNRDRFKNVSSLRNSISPTYCFVAVEKTNNESIYFTSRYGFLYVTMGDQKNPVTAADEKVTSQLDQY